MTSIIREDLRLNALRIRFNTEEEIDYTADLVIRSVQKLRAMSPLWEMHQEGIDLKSIEWTGH